MSMTAIGGPWSRRPCADLLGRREPLRAFDEAADETARRRFLERFTTARQTRIGHEILMGDEGFLARRGLYARRTAIRQELPALLIVLEIGRHNLAENLLVHRGIENRRQHFDPAVKIARHHVGGGNIYRRLGMRQQMAGTEAIDAAVLEKTADDRFHANVVGQAG